MGRLSKVFSGANHFAQNAINPFIAIAQGNANSKDWVGATGNLASFGGGGLVARAANPLLSTATSALSGGNVQAGQQAAQFTGSGSSAASNQGAATAAAHPSTSLKVGQQITNAAPGQRGDYVFGGRSAYLQRNARDDEFAAANADQKRTQARVMGVNQAFDDPTNASMIQQARDRLTNAAALQNQSQADSAYTQQLRALRANAAQAGTEQTSTYGQERGNLLSQYYAQLAGGEQQKQDVGNKFDQGLKNERQTQLAAAMGGNVAPTTGLTADAATLGQYASPGAFLGNLVGRGIPIGANAVASSRLSDAYKNPVG